VGCPFGEWSGGFMEGVGDLGNKKPPNKGWFFEYILRRINQYAKHYLANYQ